MPEMPAPPPAVTPELPDVNPKPKDTSYKKPKDSSTIRRNLPTYIDVPETPCHIKMVFDPEKIARRKKKERDFKYSINCVQKKKRKGKTNSKQNPYKRNKYTRETRKLNETIEAQPRAMVRSPALTELSDGTMCTEELYYREKIAQIKNRQNQGDFTENEDYDEDDEEEEDEEEGLESY